MNAAMLMICLAGNASFGQQETVFKAPLIEVRTETRDGKTSSYLMYNRIFMGRQYHKSNDNPDGHKLSTTYYHDKSPIGVILKNAKWFPAKGAPPVAVLGMDVGTLAAYAKPGQTLHFTERVPTFFKLSMPDKGEKRYFTFVQDAIDRGADVKIFEGEPREMLEKHGKANFYKVIVIDVHKLPDAEIHKDLMTKEAMQMLMSKVREDGIVAFHTSNRYYQMPPIIACAAKELNFACVVGKDAGYYDAEDRKEDFRFASEWVMVARDAKHLANLKKDDSNRIEWNPPRHEMYKNGKLTAHKFDKEFLWTDKGEQSFRGLFRSDPEIDKLHEVVYDVEGFIADNVHRSAYRVGRPIHNFIRAWSAASADRLNRGFPVQQKDSAETKALRIEVKTDTREGKTFSYLMYSGTYIARQYHKSNDQPDLNRLPTTYYHDKSPIGVILKNAKWFPDKGAPPVAVLGMDVGTQAAYAKPGQTFHFTERVPTLVKLSLPDKGEKPHFTFVQDAIDRGANVKVFEGEPRAMLEKHGKDKFYKLIIVQTFKTPVHELHKELMTKEALAMLMSKVREDGIVAFHTSNRYYHLNPIIASAANELKFACVVASDIPDYKDRDNDHRFSSDWVIVARDAKHLAHLKKDDSNWIDWHPPRYEMIVRGKFIQQEVDKHFLWTDKGEQSLRGLYRSDPQIDSLHNVVNDLENFLADYVHRDAYRVGQPIHGAIQAWSAASADRLNQKPAKEEMPEKK